MNKKDVEKLLKGRELIDKYRLRNINKETIEQKNSLLDGVKAELGKLGFEKDAMEEFKAFNRHMIAQEYKESLDIKFLGCAGCPTKKCVKLYGDRACMKKKDKTVDDTAALTIFSLVRSSKNWSIDEEKKEPGNIDIKKFEDVIICPEGYGYQVTGKNRLRQFDLHWRV